MILSSFFYFILKKRILPLFISQFIFVLSVVIFSSVNVWLICVFFTICTFQFLLMYEDVLINRLIPLRLISVEEEKINNVELKRKIALCLPVLIPISEVSFSFSFFALFFISVFLCKDFLSFFIKLARKEKDTCLLKGEFLNGPPEVVVYVTGLPGVAYQINQWLPVLDELNCRVAILIRKSSIARGMLPTNIPIYYARTHREVEWILVNGPKTVLYPANTAQNVQALREYKLNHFFINHGESDKAVNQSKLLMAYDKLLVGGPLAERRLREVGLPLRNNQVVHVGRPQAELLLDNNTAKPENIKRIFYAPTWEGFVENVNYSSINELGINLLNELSSLDDIEILFKPHPFTGEIREENREYLQKINNICHDAGIKILNDQDFLHEAMNWSDLLITDISSVLNEYLVTGKPIVLCNAKGYDIDVLNNEFPSSQAAYVINRGDDARLLLKSIEAEDKLYEARIRLRADSLGDTSKSAMERFSNVIYESLIS